MKQNRELRKKPTHTQIIFNKSAKIHKGEKIVPSTNGAGENWLSTCKNKKEREERGKKGKERKKEKEKRKGNCTLLLHHIQKST